MAFGRVFVVSLFCFLVSALSAQTCAPVASPTLVPAGASLQIVPHITTGQGFVTKLTIVNLASASNQVVFNDVSQSGALLDSCTATIPANGALRLTQGVSTTPTNETHWAMVGSQSPVGINLFFEQSTSTGLASAVGFNNVASGTSFTFAVEFQNSPSHTFGLAVANPTNSTNTVNVALVDSTGTTLGTRSQTLGAYGQLAADLLVTNGPLNISSLLPNGNFVGSIVVTTSGASSVLGVGDDQGPFFSEQPMNTAAANPAAPANLAATLTLSPSDPLASISNGSCVTYGVALTGARSSMTVAVSPTQDPIAVGYSNVLWSGWVDANDHVTLEFCKFAKLSAILTSPLTFNIRAIASSAASSGGTLVIPVGATIPQSGCTTVPGTVSAPSTAAVVVTPATTPAASGLDGTQFRGFVDSAGHVNAELCSPSFGGHTASSALTLNIGILN